MGTESKRPDNVYLNAYGNSNPYDEDGNSIIGGQDYGRKWTEGDQAVYDLYLKSLEYESALDVMEYNNKYNSMASQVQRAHAAGKNPDFMNIGNEPSRGSAPSAPSAPVGKPFSDTVTQYGNLAQQFLQLLPQAISIYSQVKGSLQDIEIKDLQIDKMIQDDALTFLSDNVESDWLSSQPGTKYYKSPPVLSDAFVGDFSRMRYGNTRNGRKRQERFNKALSYYVTGNMESLRNAIYSKKSSAAARRSEFVKFLGEYGYDVSDDVFVSTIKGFNEVMRNAEKSKASKESKKNSNTILADMFGQAQKLIQSDKNWDKAGGYIMYLVLSLMSNNSKFNLQD